VDAAAWNRLAGDNAFASYGWLLTLERMWRARFEPLYFTCAGGDGLSAGTVCYELKASPGIETLDDLLFGRLHGAALRLGCSFLPALICGPAQGYGWHIGTDPRLPADERDRLRRRVLDAVEEEADRRRLPLAFAHALDEQCELQALLEERRYLRSRNVPIALMDVRWASLADYFNSLPAKRRREFRRERRRNADAGVEIEALGGTRAPADRVYELLQDNARRHHSPPPPFGPEAFGELGRNMGDGVMVLVARKGESVSGAFVALEHGRAAIAYAVGVDPALGGEDFTYFNLVYYSLIERAIARGLDRIYFGRGMYSVKTRRGCRLSGASIYLRTRGALSRTLSRPWLALASAWNRSKLPAEVRRETEGAGSA